MKIQSPKAARPLLIIAAAAVSGCAATVSMAPAAEDVAAKQFMPAAGEANIYIVREDRFTGSAVAFEIQVDGTSVGSLAPGTYLLIEVDPGEHVISSTTNENQEVRRLVAEAGNNYFFEVTPRMGWLAARVGLEQVDEGAGTKLVNEGKMAEDLQAKH